MDNIVSCSGGDCGVCEFFETISRLYSYLLELSFAVAILVLIIAGFFYLHSVGDSEKRARSLSILKGGLIGFLMVLLGWLAIRTTVGVLGFKNAGNWWQFQCETEESSNSSQMTNQKNLSQNIISENGENYPTFSNITEFLDSKEPKGIVLGPKTTQEFIKQISDLPEGGTLKFLAPARMKRAEINHNSFLPLLSLKKSGGKIELENTGEALNVIQDQLSNSAGLTQKGFKLISLQGEAVPKKSLSQFDSLFAEVSGVLSTKGVEDLLGITFQEQEEIPSDGEISEFIAEGVALLEENNNYAKINDYVARLTTLTLKMLSGMLVEIHIENNPSTPTENVQVDESDTTQAQTSSYSDSDGDKISDWRDACPYTYPETLDDINRTPSEKALYGCSCKDIEGISGMACPPEMCVGNYWQTYPKGYRNCSKGHLLAYSCEPLTSTFTSDCPGLTEKATTVETDYNDDRGIPWGEGDDGTQYPSQPDSPESVKNALRMIYKYDRLRYEMIFRYVDRIIGIRDTNLTNEVYTTNGLTYDGEGIILVDYTLPLLPMAETIVHESTHAAHMYLYGLDIPAEEAERLANALEIGSIFRNPNSKDMAEFSGQSGEKLIYLGKEVRGFESRLLTKVNPESGFLGTATYYQGVRYASDFGELVQGPYHYGDEESGFVLGLTEEEENIMKKIVTNKEDCLSKPTDDLPQIPACENTDRTIKIGGWDWYPN